MMLSCWDSDPSERPSFSDLLTSLEQELFNKGVSIECSCLFLFSTFFLFLGVVVAIVKDR